MRRSTASCLQPRIALARRLTRYVSSFPPCSPTLSAREQVQSDVFRFPPYLPLFCGLLGTGVQLIIMVYLTTIFCLLGDLYIGRGAISATAVVVYALASLAGGFVSSRFYVQVLGESVGGMRGGWWGHTQNLRMAAGVLCCG